MVLRKVLPLAWFALAIAVAVTLHLLAPGGRLVPFPWTLLGVAPIVLGAALVLAAGLSLKRHGTTVKPLRRPRALVTGGAFRISRHPIYLGFVVAAGGAALVLGTLTPWLPVAALALFLDVAFVRFEEQRLTEAFGTEWETYCSRVRRWL